MTTAVGLLDCFPTLWEAADLKEQRSRAYDMECCAYEPKARAELVGTHLVGSQLGVAGACSGVAPGCSGVAPGCIGVWLPHACIGVCAPGCIGVLPPVSCGR